MIVAAIGALILSATLQLGYVHASPPIAKIISMNYPHHVLSATVFPVTVVADYSDKVGVDIGIWDVESGVVLQSISIPLRDTGSMTFTFNLTAPDETTEWRLLAITRIWWQNAWYQDPLEGSSSFTVDVSNTAPLTLASSGPPSLIALDGITYPVNATGPIDLSVTPGVHRLAAMPMIPGGTGERFVFVGWSDGVASNPRLLVISNSASLTALYRTEYYLSVKSEYGLSAGQGWYPAGSNPSFAVVPASSGQDWLGFLVGTYRFAGWSGDSGSRDRLASVIMDGPKNVEARWVPSGTAASLVIFSALMLGSLILLTRAIRRNLRGRAPRLPSHRVQQWARLILVATILIVVLIQVPSSHAQLPIQPGRSIVRIGDASWYYWNNTASDTCLIWLGGGTTDEQQIGYYSYMINPFEYESFGTLKFIQHLTTYYCLIALQKGSYEYYSPESNRTVYQEPYRMDSRIIGDVHEWIRKQGYAHTFLVGYSTGAQVAAMEVAIRAPEEWVSPDGLVLITPRLSDVVSKSAHRMKASLLVLYGGSIETPAYVSTGYEFFLDAPKDGWHNSSYLHKNFQVIEKMGHEVWTVYETGVYDTQAESILVNFVSNVEALQFTDKDLEMITHAAENTSAPGNPDLDLTSATVPTEVSTATIVRVRVVLSYDIHATGTAQVIAFNLQRCDIESSQEVFLAGSGPRVLLLAFLPPPNSTELPLAIIMVTEAGGGWKLVSGPLLTNTKVLDTINVTVASTAPGTSFVFDGSEFRIPDTGSIYLETKPGPHTVQVEPVTYLTSQTRVVFTGWEDGSTDATRLITLHNDTSILANYRVQYFVNVTSAYGIPSGSGWYDENSTVSASLEPPVVNESKVIFAQWLGDVNSSDSRILLSADSPKTVQAEWAPLPSYEWEGTNIALLLFGSFLFGLTILLNLNPVRRTYAQNDRQYSVKREGRRNRARQLSQNGKPSIETL